MRTASPPRKLSAEIINYTRFNTKYCYGCKIQKPTSDFKRLKSGFVGERCNDCADKLAESQRHKNITGISYIRRHVTSALKRVFKDNRNIEKADITMSYMVNLFIEQKGICALTGRKMTFWTKKPDSNESVGIDAVSIDRIDSSKGYIRGNVRFVTYQANIAKSRFTDDELIRFCKDIISYKEKETIESTSLLSD